MGTEFVFIPVTASEQKFGNLFRGVCLFVILGFVARALAAPPPGADGYAGADESRLRQLVQLSDVIFSGQAVSIDRLPAHGLHGSIAVTLRVETAVRGVASGTFVARFLEGSPGSFPVQPGERLVLFLHAPNAARLTSLAAGGCGIMDRTGGDRVDLRRLQLCFASPHLLANPTAGPLRLSEPRVVETQSMATSDLLRLLERMAREPSPTGHETASRPLDRANAAP
jgi:hypothetical protein